MSHPATSCAEADVFRVGQSQRLGKKLPERGGSLGGAGSQVNIVDGEMDLGWNAKELPCLEIVKLARQACAVRVLLELC